MNPLDMMKFKGMFEKFVTRHPMLPKFFARIQPEVKEGSVIELTVTPPDGEPLKANIKVGWGYGATANDKKYATKIKKTYHKCVIIRGMKERQSEGYS